MTLPAADDRPSPAVETLVETLADGVVVVRDDGVVTGVDDTISHLLGLSESMRLDGASGPAATTVRELVARARESDETVLVDTTSDGETRVVAVPLTSGVCVGLRVADGEGPPGPLELDGAARRTADDADHYRSLVRAVGDPLYMLDREGNFTFVNDALVEFTGYPAATLVGEHVSLVMGDADIETGETLIRDLLRDPAHETGYFEMNVVTAGGEAIPCENHLAIILQDGEFTGTAGVVRDISRRRRREAELTRQRNELARLNHINAVVRGIVQTLVDPAARTGLERAVCDRLADAGPYAAAWFGDYDLTARRLVPHAAVGIDEAVLDDYEATIDADPPSASAKAARTREVVVTYAGGPGSEGRGDPPGETSEEGVDECIPLLRQQGFAACAAIPVHSGDALYGILHVYSIDPNAFDDEEVAVLSELGRIVGSATRARLTEQLLHSAESRELVFHVPDRSLALVTAAAELGSTVVLDRFVPTDGPVALYYGRVVGGDPVRLAAVLADDPVVERLREVGTTDGESVFEFCLSGPFAAVEYGSHGMEFREAEARPGALFLRVSLAADASVRAAVGAITGAFPEAELVAQRRSERQPSTAHDFRVRVFDSLTPRQRAALDASVHAGYFDWPRGSTAEEIAEAMGISAATFHSHLRKAQRKVYAALYETEQ
jgi:PAS domain S-box-containing protein